MAKASSETGPSARPGRWLSRTMALALVALIVAACGALGATPAPTPTPSPTPTPVVQPDAKSVLAACGGKAVPGTDVYDGSTHPLVVVEGGAISEDSYPINGKYLDGQWSSPLQIVICADPHHWVRIKDCGTVTRVWSLGNVGKISERGRLYLVQDTQQVRVILAQTGKTLVTKMFYGAKWTCERAQNSTEGANQGPPWSVGQPLADDGQIARYADSVVGEMEG
jgi:hypothetical protein